MQTEPIPNFSASSQKPFAIGESLEDRVTRDGVSDLIAVIITGSIN